MPKADEPLHENEVGSYGDLISRPNPHRLVIMPVPPFESMLGTIERRMGRKLTPEEIETERRRAVCMVVSPEMAGKVAAARKAGGESSSGGFQN
jgi:hypothetical protein